MASNETLMRRVRAALAHIAQVEEKKMFAGHTFMVNGKMCISVGHDRLMCRIDPAMHEEALEQTGSRTVVMKGRTYRGYVYVDVAGLKTSKEFDYWIRLALDFNPQAKSSVRGRRRQPIK